jgi:hypothetical protein
MVQGGVGEFVIESKRRLRSRNLQRIGEQDAGQGKQQGWELWLE